jgi:hypothetical protein
VAKIACFEQTEDISPWSAAVFFGLAVNLYANSNLIPAAARGRRDFRSVDLLQSFRMLIARAGTKHRTPCQY